MDSKEWKVVRVHRNFQAFWSKVLFLNRNKDSIGLNEIKNKFDEYLDIHISD